MNAQAALLSAFASFKAVYPSAVVTIVVQVDPNTAVTTIGLRSNTTIARAIQRGGLSNNTDVSVWVLASVFADITILPGKATATITDAAGVVTSGRLLPVRLHALGGLANLAIGEYDRVVA